MSRVRTLTRTSTTAAATDAEVAVTGTDVGAKRAQDTYIAGGALTTTANTAGSIANNASISTTPVAFAAPANAKGFILEAMSTNTDSVRWAIGASASPSVGLLFEPGRDSGFIACAATISVVALSGTQEVAVQWILSS